MDTGCADAYPEIDHEITRETAGKTAPGAMAEFRLAERPGGTGAAV